MTFDECRLLIPQYLSGDLSAVEYESFEATLDRSVELQFELEQMRPVWEKLALLPQEEPSAAMRARFYQRLNALERNRSVETTRPFSRYLKLWPQFSLGLLLFVSGLALGRMKINESARSNELAAQAGEISKMTSQVQGLRELVALSLLERQSAGSRLEGVSWSNRIDQPNDQVVAALLGALNHDANVNVRLSSVDALERFATSAAVRKALVDSIARQDSPLVQIALIDSFVNIRNRAAAGELKKLSAAANVNPAVRQRAEWGLQKLSFE